MKRFLRWAMRNERIKGNEQGYLNELDTFNERKRGIA
jgi:hypothetical protein